MKLHEIIENLSHNDKSVTQENLLCPLSSVHKACIDEPSTVIARLMSKCL